jgi:hypothetical protein
VVTKPTERPHRRKEWESVYHSMTSRTYITALVVSLAGAPDIIRAIGRIGSLTASDLLGAAKSGRPKLESNHQHGRRAVVVPKCCSVMEQTASLGRMTQAIS